MIVDETFASGKRKRGSKVEKKGKNEKKSPKRKRDKKIKTEPKIGNTPFLACSCSLYLSEVKREPNKPPENWTELYNRIRKMRKGGFND